MRDRGVVHDVAALHPVDDLGHHVEGDVLGDDGDAAPAGHGLGHAAPGDGGHVGHHERDRGARAVDRGQVDVEAGRDVGAHRHHEHVVEREVGVGQSVVEEAHEACRIGEGAPPDTPPPHRRGRPLGTLPRMTDGKMHFRRMDEGTDEDFQVLARVHTENMQKLPDLLMGMLGDLRADADYPVDRLTHSLQTATRALRDGADDELIVCALFHDVGESLGPDEPRRGRGRHPAPVHLRAEPLDARAPRPVPDLLLRRAPGPRPQRPRRLPGQPLLPVHRRLLRQLGRGLLRPRLPERAHVDLRAHRAPGAPVHLVAARAPRTTDGPHRPRPRRPRRAAPRGRRPPRAALDPRRRARRPRRHPRRGPAPLGRAGHPGRAARLPPLLGRRAPLAARASPARRRPC